MIECSGNSIGFYVFYTASKVGKTGLTVTIDVWERVKGGSTAEIVTGGSATEIGDGIYEYVLASGSVDATGEYLAVFKTADATVDQKHIPAVWSINRGGIADISTASTVVEADGEFGTIPADLYG
jgi:hypothetical protein